MSFEMQEIDYTNGIVELPQQRGDSSDDVQIFKHDPLISMKIMDEYAEVVMDCIEYEGKGNISHTGRFAAKRERLAAEHIINLHRTLIDRWREDLVPPEPTKQ